MNKGDIEAAAGDGSIQKWSRERLVEALSVIGQTAGSGPRAKKWTDYAPLLDSLLKKLDLTEAEQAAVQRHDEVLCWTKRGAYAAIIAAICSLFPAYCSTTAKHGSQLQQTLSSSPQLLTTPSPSPTSSQP